MTEERTEAEVVAAVKDALTPKEPWSRHRQALHLHSELFWWREKIDKAMREEHGDYAEHIDYRIRCRGDELLGSLEVSGGPWTVELVLEMVEGNDEDTTCAIKVKTEIDEAIDDEIRLGQLIEVLAMGNKFLSGDRS